MSKSLLLRLAQGATLIAEDRLAAVQLEAFALRSSAPTHGSAWRSPSISSQAAWADEMWLRFATDDRSLLTGSQTAALWRKIVAESAEGAELVDHARIAAWAAAAWGLLWSWRIDHGGLRANAGDPAFAAFLRWARTFDELTADASWIDAARLAAALAGLAAAGKLPRREMLWLDPSTRSPMLDHLVASLSAGGCRAELWSPNDLHGTARRIGVADRREEVLAASRWARRRLGDDPSLRLAIVVAPEDAGAQQLDWGLDESVSPEDEHAAIVAANLDGERLERDPAIGAALTCVELAGEHADFGVLSRWLRSPFLGRGIEDRAARCIAEAGLRPEPVAQLRFRVGFRRAGLRSWLERRVPQATSVLDALVTQVEELPRLQSSTRWARFFSALLKSCGWPGSDCGVPQGSLDAWGEALDDLTRLSPILGAIDVETALAELRSIVGRRRLHSPAPLHGVCVLPRAELVGYGYDAVWITGMSDRTWPRAAEPNPLLPLRLQTAHGMPLATPASALSWSRDVLASLARRVPELICSYPLVEDDHSAAPSPLIGSFPELPEISPVGPMPHSRRAGAVESLDDPAPGLVDGTVVGGATTLRWQARCPLRAFVESRLAAKPLEVVARGLSPRQRGIATHRALELLMAGIPGRAALAALSADERRSRIRASSHAALRERARGAERELRVFLDLERERVEGLLETVLLAELQRTDFTIEGLEIRHIAQLEGLRVECRIDRLDRLSDGRVAIIDYKTGQPATPLDWLRPRLLEPQLPLYARVTEDTVGALVLAGLQTTGVVYRGLWAGDAAFPARPQPLPPGVGWTEQQQRWSRQLTELLTEYAAGDTRISASGWDAVAGALAPLTRVYESLLLHRDSSEAHGT